MNLTKGVLKAIKPAMSKDGKRYDLNGALIEPNRITATDGHRVHRVTFRDTLAGFEPAVVERAALLGLESNLPRKKNGQPAPEYVVDVKASNEGPNVVGEVNTSAGRMTVSLPKKDGANFPDADKVIPKGDGTVTFGINANYLIDALKAAIDSGAVASRSCAVKITVTDANSAIRIDASHGGTEFVAVIMPMRI